MKPFHIAIGVAVGAIALSGFLVVRGKLQHAANGRAIEKLVKEYKEMGVATNGEEYFHKIPDSENAWDELQPLLIKKGAPEGSSGVFEPGISLTLVRFADKADLDVLDKYLTQNKSTREAIARALEQKPKIQVSHDYNEGDMMLAPECAFFRNAAREFCVAALRAGIQGDAEEATRNLQVACDFANSCLERGDWVAQAVGTSIQHLVIQTALRVVEVAPNLYQPIRDFMMANNRFVVHDMKPFFRYEFLSQIASIRYFDSPLIDVSEPPFPLNKLTKTPTDDDIYAKAHPRPGDYLPESAADRKYLLAVMEAWKPLMREVAESKGNEFFTSFSKYEAVLSVQSQEPESLKKVYDLSPSSEASEDGYIQLFRNKHLADANQAIWKILDVKRKTGKYPAKLDAIWVDFSSFSVLGGILYKLTENGFILQTRPVTAGDGAPDFIISYPATTYLPLKSQQKQKQDVQDYRKGVIDRLGQRPKAGRPTSPLPSGD
ncbi:MAG: hypothetical protein JST51_16530 [Armatimonadetes bacterium]|nr:hypothetical protein [Armatimonadota bacterium]